MPSPCSPFAALFLSRPPPARRTPPTAPCSPPSATPPTSRATPGRRRGADVVHARLRQGHQHLARFSADGDGFNRRLRLQCRDLQEEAAEIFRAVEPRRRAAQGDGGV